MTQHAPATRPAAIVTGGSSGVGRVTAIPLANEGYDVGITFSLGEERARDVAKTIESFGVRAAIARQDLAKPAEAAQALESLIRQLGRLNAFVNNVGINHRGAFLELPVVEWNEVLTDNLTGAFLCGQAAVRHMTSSRAAGRIVNVTSILDREVLEGGAAYCVLDRETQSG
jgi:NAD(P)-dependent dehydrogenase (short-subunit alcohol dehydrogenase family)